MLELMKNCSFIVTDSGGIQEETTILNVPCLTLRENTERPITIQQGTNVLVGTDTEKIIAESQYILDGKKISSKMPELWDGNAAQRIVNILVEQFSS